MTHNKQAVEVPALLPCPFCGGGATFEHLENGQWSIGCADIDGDCMGFQSLQSFARKADAIAAWNTRTTHQATIPSQGDKLREALERMVYEATHLSPCKPNGDHDCTIKADALAQARAALATPVASSTRPASTPDREAVAKIIDPIGWGSCAYSLARAKFWSSEGANKRMADDYRCEARHLVTPSLKKADAILALFNSEVDKA